MQIPFFRNFTPGIQFLYVFSLIFLGGMIGEVLMFGMRAVFWKSMVIDGYGSHLTDSELAYARLNALVMPLCMFITPAFIFRYLMEFPHQDYLVVRQKPKRQKMLYVLLLLILCFAVSNFLHYVNSLFEFSKTLADYEKREEEITMNILMTKDITMYLVNLIGIGVITAIGEELIFRSIFQRLFLKMFRNVHLAVVFCALLFSLAHFSYNAFIPRFFMGMALGYIYVCTGNIWYSIFFHFLNNAISITFGWLLALGFSNGYVSNFGYLGFTRWIGLAILLGLIVFAVLKLPKLIQQDFVEECIED